ncbi:hypothetical protein [Levilactobacillus tujiorum]|uniref:hypothetical protein n=1 Tax=Levilactobacillus tujiorum TaxID=2912243 RepID=UPI00145790B0|nr:hypothetical protein [Levilactobacillus tujiorum]NLR32834.1 hypothetical protein [Levilactobacillus tujiorum]
MQIPDNYRKIGDYDNACVDGQAVMNQIDAEYDGSWYRAMLYPDVNQLRVVNLVDANGNPIRMVVAEGYKLDAQGDNRLDRDDNVEYDDIDAINKDDIRQLFVRCSGDRTLQWLLPPDFDINTDELDFSHPTFIG